MTYQRIRGILTESTLSPNDSHGCCVKGGLITPMATFIPVPDTAMFELVFTQNGEFAENVYHVEHPGGWSEANLLTTCAAFHDWWMTHVKIMTGLQVQLEKILGTDMSDQFGPRVEYVTGLPQVGGLGSGDGVPNHVAVAVKWLTAKRGRSYRGRTYHFGLRSTQFSNNTVSAGIVADLRTAYNALIVEVEGAGGDRLVVASRYANKMARDPGVATPIIACTVDPIIDSQRRRLPGRGR